MVEEMIHLCWASLKLCVSEERPMAFIGMIWHQLPTCPAWASLCRLTRA